LEKENPGYKRQGNARSLKACARVLRVSSRPPGELSSLRAWSEQSSCTMSDGCQPNASRRLLGVMRAGGPRSTARQRQGVEERARRSACGASPTGWDDRRRSAVVTRRLHVTTKPPTNPPRPPAPPTGRPAGSSPATQSRSRRGAGGCLQSPPGGTRRPPSAQTPLEAAAAGRGRRAGRARRPPPRTAPASRSTWRGAGWSSPRPVRDSSGVSRRRPGTVDDSEMARQTPATHNHRTHQTPLTPHDQLSPKAATGHKQLGSLPNATNTIAAPLQA
jgi:hypothetical protein